MNRQIKRFGAVLAMAMLWPVGCADLEPEIPENAPTVSRVEKTSLMIGETFAMQGRNFLPDGEGTNYVRFEGTFTAASGFASPVQMEVPVFISEQDETTGSQNLVWTRFGPFQHPFSAEGRVGTFNGNLIAVTEGTDGTRVRGGSRKVAIEVQPSIEILGLQPVGADCGVPALSGFGGLPYQMHVRALGFTPDQFEYQITSLQGAADLTTPKTIQKTATGPDSRIELEDDMVFQDVPADTKFYVAGILVRARDKASGRFVESVLPFEIHRPIEIDYNGNYQVAEFYEPEPVTACIPGTIGNRVTYSETHSDTRQRALSVRMSQSWVQDRTIGSTSNWTEGYQEGEMVSSTTSQSETNTDTEGSTLQRGQTYNESEANSFNYGTTNAETWNSSHTVGGDVKVEVGAEGGVGIPMVAEGKVRSSVAVTGRYSYNTGQGGSAAATNNWGSTTNRGRSDSLNQSYTLSSSNSQSRSLSDTTSRSNSRTYSFGGTAIESERISQGMTEDEAQTWSESSTDTTLTAFTGFIPVNKFGVFYRQTVRLARVAQVVSYNACGERELMGEMVFNEWKWAPALAIGDDCGAQLPQSNLPKAQCIVQPCN